MMNYQELYELELAKNAKLTRVMLEVATELRAPPPWTINAIADRLEKVRAENLSKDERINQLISMSAAQMSFKSDGEATVRCRELGRQLRETSDALSEANRRREVADRKVEGLVKGLNTTINERDDARREWEYLRAANNELSTLLNDPDQRDWVTDVHAFMVRFDQPIAHSHFNVSRHSESLRNKLLMEEVTELQTAVFARDGVEIADALADILYIVIGTAITYGIDLRPVWAEVHRSNMAKEGGGMRADGKILKPVGWTPPDIAGALKRGAL